MNKLRIIAVAICSVLAITSVTGCHPIIPPGDSDLSGTVTATYPGALSTHGFAGQMVVAYRTTRDDDGNLPVAAVTTTARNGSYRFTNLAKGTYLVTAEGTLDHATTVDTNTGPAVVDFELTKDYRMPGPGQPGPDTGVVKGLISYGNVDGSDSLVGLVGPGSKLVDVTTSAQDGSFVFADLAPGYYGVFVLSDRSGERGNWWGVTGMEPTPPPSIRVRAHAITDLGTGGVRGVDCDPAIFHPGGSFTHRHGATLDLRNCDMSGVDLTDTTFNTNSDLRGVKLTGANVTGTQFTTVHFDDVASGGLVGTPAALPSGVALANGYLVGPDLALRGAQLQGVEFHGSLDGSNLADANLSAASLTDTTFDNANLDGADLTGASLESASFHGTHFDGANLTTANIDAADFTNADLEGVSSENLVGVPTNLPAPWALSDGYLIGGPGAGLANIDLHGATIDASPMLKGGNLTGANLAGASLRGTDLTNTVLTGANLDGADLRDANLTGVRSGSISGTPILSGGWLVYQGTLVGPGANLTGADLRGLSVYGNLLQGADLTNANLAEATFVTGHALPTPTFSDTKLIGTNLSKVDLTNVDLTGVYSSATTGTLIGLPSGWRVIGGALFGPGAHVRGLTVTASMVGSVDFSGQNLAGIDLSGSTFLGTSFSGADLTGANLTDTTFDGIDLSHAVLDGATLSGTHFKDASLDFAHLQNTAMTNAVFETTGVTSANLTNATGTATLYPNRDLPPPSSFNADFRDWSYATCPNGNEATDRDLTVFDPTIGAFGVSATTCFGQGLEWG